MAKKNNKEDSMQDEASITFPPASEGEMVHMGLNRIIVTGFFTDENAKGSNKNKNYPDFRGAGQSWKDVREKLSEQYGKMRRDGLKSNEMVCAYRIMDAIKNCVPELQKFTQWEGTLWELGKLLEEHSHVSDLNWPNNWDKCRIEPLQYDVYCRAAGMPLWSTEVKVNSKPIALNIFKNSGLEKLAPGTTSTGVHAPTVGFECEYEAHFGIYGEDLTRLLEKAKKGASQDLKEEADIQEGNMFSLMEDIQYKKRNSLTENNQKMLRNKLCKLVPGLVYKDENCRYYKELLYDKVALATISWPGDKEKYMVILSSDSPVTLDPKQWGNPTVELSTGPVALYDEYVLKLGTAVREAANSLTKWDEIRQGKSINNVVWTMQEIIKVSALDPRQVVDGILIIYADQRPEQWKVFNSAVMSYLSIHRNEPQAGALPVAGCQSTMMLPLGQFMKYAKKSPSYYYTNYLYRPWLEPMTESEKELPAILQWLCLEFRRQIGKKVNAKGDGYEDNTHEKGNTRLLKCHAMEVFPFLPKESQYLLLSKCIYPAVGYNGEPGNEYTGSLLKDFSYNEYLPHNADALMNRVKILLGQEGPHIGWPGDFWAHALQFYHQDAAHISPRIDKVGNGNDLFVPIETRDTSAEFNTAFMDFVQCTEGGDNNMPKCDIALPKEYC